MKKVVVTGGSGKLGQFVIRDLLERDYCVLNLDRVVPREKLSMTWQVDLRHAGDLFEAMRGAHGIIHLGAYQAPNLAPDAETLSNNVSATYNVLRAAADMGVKRVVLASSTAAFGFIYATKLWAPKYLPMDEDASIHAAGFLRFVQGAGRADRRLDRFRASGHDGEQPALSPA